MLVSIAQLLPDSLPLPPLFLPGAFFGGDDWLSVLVFIPSVLGFHFVLPLL